MHRRELLKASLAGAAAMGISPGRAAEAEGAPQAPSMTAMSSTPADAAQPLVSLSDYEAAAKRKLSVPAWEYFNGGSGDELYDKAVDIVLRERKASTSFLQRHLQLGYNKAATLIERMEREGLISPATATGKREIYGRGGEE